MSSQRLQPKANKLQSGTIKLALARRLIAEGQGKAEGACMTGVGPATLRRALNAATER